MRRLISWVQKIEDSLFSITSYLCIAYFLRRILHFYTLDYFDFCILTGSL